jgi:glycosyltransferase involved in cell wall biosynthesis
MNLHEITPLILTYNEEPNIRRCLERLRWAREVVVIDSGSTDDTLKICDEFPNVRVVTRVFDNHTNQWNFGLQQIQTRWVLTLDADYIVPESFVKEIERCDPGKSSVYFARFRFVMMGRVLRGNIYPPRAVLFDKGKHEYVADGHTQKLRVDVPSCFLVNEILHDDRKPLERWVKNQIAYSRLEAEKLCKGENLDINDRIRLWLWIAPLLMPWFMLIRYGLWRDGIPGWAYILQRTCSEILVALAVIERKFTQKNP